MNTFEFLRDTVPYTTGLVLSLKAVAVLVPSSSSSAWSRWVTFPGIPLILVVGPFGRIFYHPRPDELWHATLTSVKRFEAFTSWTSTSLEQNLPSKSLLVSNILRNHDSRCSSAFSRRDHWVEPAPDSTLS